MKTPATYPIKRFIEVDRSAFSLTLWKRDEGEMRFKRSHIYPISVGKKGYETALGLYLIHERSNAPDWQMPDSDWVPEDLRGTIVKAGDPANPIKARWLGFYAGMGIHGTDASESIGQAASHGCLRMKVPDVIDLFPNVPKFTPIRILR